MTQLFANNAFSTLAGAITNTATSLTVQAGAGAKFPSPSGGDYFLVTLFQLIGGIEANHEVVKVTARSVDTFTIVRGQEGTTARAWDVGDQVSHRGTAGTLGGLAQLGASGQAFTSPVSVPTASAGTNTDQAASTAFVTAAVTQAKADLIASSPAALDTLNELAAALGNDANFSTTMATALGNRLRVDVNTQGLNSTQKSNAVTNLGLAAVAVSGAKADVGLGNVDNTSDTNKPVSSATQTALDLKANLSGATFTGSVSTTGDYTLATQGGRFIADFSNATLSNRGNFQTSVTNGSTSVGFRPNGSGTSAQVNAFNGSDMTNSAYMSVGADATATFLDSKVSGTGTQLPIAFRINNSEVARFDTSGNFGLGQTAPSKYLHGGSARVLELLNSDAAVNSQSHLVLSTGCAAASTSIGTVSFVIPGITASNKLLAYISASTDPSHTSTAPSSTLRFATRTAGGALTDNMILDGSGNLLVGVMSGTTHTINKTGAVEGDIVLIAQGGGNSASFFRHVAGAGGNAANTALSMKANSTTLRSINVGGTVNASGADYAEYMTKAADCGVLAKGQIVGVDAHGKLTNKWADAVSFLIKSTDPSYVGGDVWGSEEALGIARPDEPVFMAPVYTGASAVLTEPHEGDSDEIKAQRAQYEADQQAYAAQVAAARHTFDTVTMPAYQAALADFEAVLEAARQKVDRIAYCGQVPVNVTGATPGQYVVPVQVGTGIGAQLVNKANLTMAQYISAIGVVQNILADGRANVRVKVI